MQQHVLHAAFPSAASLPLSVWQGKSYGLRLSSWQPCHAGCYELKKPWGRMPIDKRVQSTAEALEGVADGATVFITGFGGAGFPTSSFTLWPKKARRTLLWW